MLFEWDKRTYIMGILNATPDSFSGDGVWQSEDESEIVATAVAQAIAFQTAGADIIDIGGQSSRPGSEPVSAEVELARVLPVIKGVRAAVDIPLSIDTYYADVAEAALAAGVNWVNDVWGLQMDERMGQVVAQAGCPVVLMHNRSKPKNVAQSEKLGGHYIAGEYDNLIVDVCQDLLELVEYARTQGIRDSQIILDPGVGFGKTVAQNIQLIQELDTVKALGYPVLLGTSRKSFIGYTLDLPPAERLEGTAVTVTIGIERGADVIRVHDVAAMVRVARMTDAIVRATF